MTSKFARISYVSREFVVVSKKHSFNNHLTLFLSNRKSQGSTEMQDETLASVGTQERSTHGCHVFDLDDTEFRWENPDLNTDAVFQRSIDTPYSVQLSTLSRWVLQLEIQFWLRNSRTRRILIPVQQLQSPREQLILLCWWEVALLEQELRMIPNMYTETCLNTIFKC